MTSMVDIAASRAFIRKYINPFAVILTAIMLAFFWFRSLAVEPFDFDESVYRQMAEEVKRAGGWLSQPIFNGEVYHHKPPTYIALLALFSTLADGSIAQVTSFSSRTLSIFFSVASVFLIHQTWIFLSERKAKDTFESRRVNEFSVSPVYFVLMSFLPTIASSAVLLDPMLVFFTSLVVCCESIRLAKPKFGLGKKSIVLLGSVTGMTLATATKGLIGLVLPAGAAFLYALMCHFHELKQSGREFILNVLRTGIFHFFPVWLTALIFSTIFYYFLWMTGGSAFVEEFFIKHHFGRATAAMEGHSGSVFYYLPILIVGGGFSVAWLGYAILLSSLRRENSKLSALGSKLPNVELWLMSWCFFGVLFFSFLATKLPNYIWPIWPVLALWCAIAARGRSWRISEPCFKGIHFIVRWIPFLFPATLLAGGVIILMWKPIFADWILLKPREDAVVEAALEHFIPLSIGFIVAGLFLFAGALLLRWWGELSLKRRRESVLLSHGTARWIALFQVFACSVLMMLVIPAAEEVMTISVQQSTAKAKMFLGVGETLATSDLYSPNVVSSHGAPVHFGMGDDEWIFKEKRFNVILTPVWNVGLCQRHGYDIAQGSDFLRVCLRAYKRTLEGPGR